MVLDTTRFKKLLEEELLQIEKDLSREAEKTEDAPAVWVMKPEAEHEAEADRNDAADDIEEFDTRRSIFEELTKRYDDVVHALEKIDEGIYGIDEIDGEAIPHDRLMANPSARTKIENAHLVE